MSHIYLMGSLRNPEVPKAAKKLRAAGNYVFDDWFAASPTADDAWRDYEKARGHDLTAALMGYAANHIFDFDKHHLDLADTGILLLPSGKSGHLELGYLIGKGIDCYIVYPEEPERFDVMYLLANQVFNSIDQLIRNLYGVRT